MVGVERKNLVMMVVPTTTNPATIAPTESVLMILLDVLPLQPEIQPRSPNSTLPLLVDYFQVLPLLHHAYPQRIVMQ